MTVEKVDFDSVLKRKSEAQKYLDKITGSMIGGAVGDALGYPIEFMSWDEIKGYFGGDGITAYYLNGITENAVISDDTQMALFTANGILVGETRLFLRGIGGVPHV